MLSPERLQTEVCTPLSSVLMILQSLMQVVAQMHARSLVLSVISQVNMLIFMFSNILDRRMIKLGEFRSGKEVFDPTKTIQFIV